jgi:putative DNA primase/helicase
MGDSLMVSECDFEDLTGKKGADNQPDEPLGDIQSISKRLMKQYVFATTTKDEELFCYDSNKGVYSPDPEWLIKQQCRLSLPKTKNHQIQEVISFIKDSTYVDRSIFDSKPDFLNLGNGLINIHTGEWREHSPEEYCLSRIPIKYDRKARCPKFARFLSQILKPKDIPSLLEFMGYCFYRSAKFEKALLCIGKGDNGKSTLLKALERCIGEENTSNATLQELSGGTFATADLYGKLINTSCRCDFELDLHLALFVHMQSLLPYCKKSLVLIISM